MTCERFDPRDAVPAEPAFLSVERLSHRFGAQPVLDGVSLDLRRGEFLTLLGPSGCGKTTLLRLVAGFEAVQTGRILLEGRDLGGLPAARRPVNTVFQNYALFPHMSVAGNVGFGLRMLGHGAADIRRRVDEMLDLVRLTPLRDRRIGELSGGQQQRVALARALAPAPRLLLLDEPLSALDHRLRREMQAELKRIQRDLGMTFLFVTHDQEEALTLSDRIAVLEGGRLQQCDTPEALYHRPANRFVAAFMGGTNFLTGRLRSVAQGRAWVELGGHVIDLPLDGRVPGDGAVTLMIRPEHIRPGAHDGLRLVARAVATRFAGADHELHLRLEGGEALTARLRGPAELPAPGEALTVTLPPAHLRIVEVAP